MTLYRTQKGASAHSDDAQSPLESKSVPATPSKHQEIYEQLKGFLPLGFTNTPRRMHQVDLMADYVEQLIKQNRVDENLACSQIMANYWKTSEMIKAAKDRRTQYENR